MPQISIAAGDTRLIREREGPETLNIASLRGNDIRVARTPGQAPNGRLIPVGTRGNIHAGGRERIFAHNPDRAETGQPARLDFDKGNFAIDFDAPAVFDSASEEAARRGTTKQFGIINTPSIATGSQQLQQLGVVDEDPILIDEIQLVPITSGPAQDVWAALEVEDDSGDTIRQTTTNLVEAGKTAEPPVRVRPSDKLIASYVNRSGTAGSVGFGLTYRVLNA